MIRKIVETMQQGLYDKLGIYVVETNSNDFKPGYPYLSYNILNAKTKTDGRGIYSAAIDKDKVELQQQMILSINAYSDSSLDAIESIQAAYHYFKHDNFLEDINAAVVTTSDITDRTVYITDKFEYRYGFDIWIRYLDRIERNVYTIEKWEVDYKDE